MNNTGWWQERITGLPYGLEDLELIGDNLFVVGVPIDLPTDFKKRIFAGAKSFLAGLKSIDYTLKKYGENWQLETKHQETDTLIFKIMSEVKRQVIQSLDYAMGIPDKPEHLFPCSAALVRLQNTFQAASLCIRSGLHFEAAALERIILEQLAWIFVVHDLSEGSKDFFSINPTACITPLKTLFPTAGSFYGSLSESSHMLPKTTARYIQPKDGQLLIKLNTPIYSVQDAYLLLRLADMYAVLSEYIYRQLVTKWKLIIKKKDGSIIPNPKRPTAKLLKQILKEVLLLIRTKNKKAQTNSAHNEALHG